MKKKHNKGIRNNELRVDEKSPREDAFRPCGKFLLATAAFQIIAVGMSHTEPQSPPLDPSRENPPASLSVAPDQKSSISMPLMFQVAWDISDIPSPTPVPVNPITPPSGGGYRPPPSAPPDDAAARQRALDEARAKQQEEERQRALDEARQKQRVEEQQRAELEAKAKQEAFEKAKQEALGSMKGITGNGLGLKGVDGGDTLGLKGIEDSPANNLGLKGIDDSSRQLKDAVADSNNQTLFAKKKASEDLLSGNAHGISALDRAASILPSAASNPSLETALEQAKAEADRRFSTGGKDAGQFDAVVLTGESGAPQNQPVKIPEEITKDPRKLQQFQKLVTERDALDHQIEVGQQKLTSIKADSSYAQNPALLTDAFNQHNAIESLKVMRSYDDKQITRMVHLEPVDSGEGTAPPPKNNIDKIVVPSPGTDSPR